MPVSLERIRDELQKDQTVNLRLRDLHVPAVVFKATVERDYMPSFQEQLKKEFTLNDFQRQSQEWSSKCCGLNLIELANRIDRFLKKREARRIREEVARELAQLEAAGKKK